MTHSPAVTEGALLHFKRHLLSRRDRYLVKSSGIDREKELGRAKVRRARNVEKEYMVVMDMITQWGSNQAQVQGGISRSQEERAFVVHVGC